MFILVLFASLLVEIFVTIYTISVAKELIPLAMVASGAISIADSYLVVVFTRDNDLIFAIALGQVIGTGLAMYGYKWFCRNPSIIE